MKNEVDYSQFIYKRETEEAAVTTAPVSLEYDVGGKPRKKKKQAGNFFFVAFVLILCFSLIILVTDIFSNGKIVSAISAAIRKNDYEYYLVTTECNDGITAQTKSAALKSGGGAGYIYKRNEKFYVTFSAYYDEKDAEAVSVKNSAQVLAVGRRGKNGFYTALDGYLRELCENVIAYDNGELSDSAFNGAAERIKSSVEKLYSEKNTTEKGRELCLFIKSGLENLNVSEGVKSEFLSRARYFLSGWIVSMCEN